MISIGIIGGSGYTGKKLLEFCAGHPFVKECKVYGYSTAGEDIYSVFPELAGIVENSGIESVNKIKMDHDLYFIALPHGEALKYVPMLIENEKKVIDLGGDYRLDSGELFSTWYKLPHTSENLLKTKQYGLADYYAYDFHKTSLIANPGCYPTATLLPLLPFVTEEGNNILSISTAAYSGTSGAGKTAKQNMLMSEMYGNARAYNVNNHRHQPEIEQELKKKGLSAPFAFTTHLLPVSVGIYATTTVHLKNSVSQADMNDLYEKAYQYSPFVRLRNTAPDLNWVVGTNFCDINISVKDKVMVITSAIDNLIKGASGQAIQNMNKIYNWEETLGLLKRGMSNVSVD